VGLVDGFVIDGVMSARSAIQPLELAYFFDTYESGAQIIFSQRGSKAAVVALAPGDLVEEKPGADPYQLVRTQDTELPQVARVGFVDADQHYLNSAAESRRLAGRSARVASANLPLITTATTAQAIADTMLQDAWASRTHASFRLPQRLLALEPSDIVDLALPNHNMELRITSLTDGLGRATQAMSIQRSVYDTVAAPPRPQVVVGQAAFGAPAAVFMDLPLLRGDEVPTAPRFAATQSPWPGGVAVYRATDGIDFVLNTSATSQATMGVTTAPLAAGPVSRWDKANTLTVKLFSGQLGTQSQIAVLAGANVAALQTAPGVFEVLQFVNATLVAPQTYQLGPLLRGQAGTEQAMAASLPVGATFVLIDGSVTFVDETAGQLNLPQPWRYGPANRPIGNQAYQTQTLTFTGIGTRPLSPVQISGTRSNCDLTINWIRRTRIGGDSWDQIEVPLAEASEAYQVDILSPSGSVLRTLNVTSPSAVYPAGLQTADFGAPQRAIGVNVYQISQSFGRGTPRAATV